MYPVFDLAFDIGDRQRAMISRAMVPANDSTFLAVVPAEGIFMGGAIGVSVPLNFSSGGHETSLEPSITAKFTNDMLGESFAFYDKKGENEMAASASGKSHGSRRSGRPSALLCPQADQLTSGAITVTRPSLRAALARAWMPGALIPSSLVITICMRPPFSQS